MPSSASGSDVRLVRRPRPRPAGGSSRSSRSSMTQASIKEVVEAFQEREKEKIRRRREIESLDGKRAARSLWYTQFEFGSGCVIFYLSLIFMCINIGMFLLRVGPYKLKYTIHLHEKESIQTRTRYPFEIFVHKSKYDKFVSVALQKHGQWEIDLHERMMRVMHGFKNATLVDIGAHVGFHALGAAAAGHRSIAVEPIALSVEMINKSIVHNAMEEHVEIVHAAALDERTPKVCMHQSLQNKGHSFVRPRSAPHTPTTYRIALWRLLVRFFMWVFNLHQVVPHWNRRYDHVLDYHKRRHHSDHCEYSEGVVLGEMLEGRKDVFAVKADVEGSEYRALKGLLPHLQDSPPCYIFMEFFPAMLHMQGDTGEDLLELVTSHGYEVFTVGGHVHVNRSVLPHFAEGGFLKRDTEYKGHYHDKFKEKPLGDMILLELQRHDLEECLRRFEKEEGLPEYEEMGVLSALEVAPEPQDDIPVPEIDRSKFLECDNCTWQHFPKFELPY